MYTIRVRWFKYYVLEKNMKKHKNGLKEIYYVPSNIVQYRFCRPTINSDFDVYNVIISFGVN